MNFKGLIISDGMEMKAISDHYGIGNGCVMALNAGCDLLLLCHDVNEQIAAFEAVKKAVEDGIISVDLLKEKVERINKAKLKVREGLKNNFNILEYIKVNEEHEIMQEIVDNSFTLILGEEPVLKNNTLIISCNAKVASIVEDEFDDRNLTNALIHNFKSTKVLKFIYDDFFINYVLDIYKDYDNIIIYSYDAYNNDIQKKLINSLLETDIEVFIVSIKEPIDMQYFKNLKNYSCLYEYTPNSIRTIIKQLKNEIKLKGKLPE